VLSEIGEANNRRKEVSNALTAWPGTPIEDRIRLFQGWLLAGGGKIRDGIRSLDHFFPTNAQYTKAQETAAKISFMKLNDKAAAPNKTNSIRFGDAYCRDFLRVPSVPQNKEISMRLACSFLIVHNCSAAISAYVHAISLNNNDPQAQFEHRWTLVTLGRLDETRDLALESNQNLDTETGGCGAQSGGAEFYD
jgi:hypothetical protein